MAKARKPSLLMPVADRRIEYNADIGDRLIDLMESKKAPERELFKPAVRLVGRALDHITASVMHYESGSYKKRVNMPKGSIIFALSNGERFVLLVIPQQDELANNLILLAKEFRSYAKKYKSDVMALAPSVIDGLLDFYGQSFGMDGAAAPEDAVRKTLAALFAAIPDSEIHYMLSLSEVAIQDNICPVFVSLSSDSGASDMRCWYWPLALPLAPYIDPSIAFDESEVGHA
jgi:hypothetical protein